MSQLSATVHIYDVMTNVFLTCDVREYSPEPDKGSRPVITFQHTIPGVGETDPREWLRDALIGIVEAL